MDNSPNLPKPAAAVPMEVPYELQAVVSATAPGREILMLVLTADLIAHLAIGDLQRFDMPGGQAVILIPQSTFEARFGPSAEWELEP